MTGLGAVIAHPENTVAGVPLGDKWFGTAELRVTDAHVRLPVANGFSSFENVALHALVGVGWRDAR